MALDIKYSRLFFYFLKSIKPIIVVEASKINADFFGLILLAVTMVIQMKCILSPANVC